MDKEAQCKERNKRRSFFITHPPESFYIGLTPEEIAFVNQPVHYCGEEPSEAKQNLDVLYRHKL